MVDRSFYKQTTLTNFSSEEAPLPPVPQKIGPYKIEGLLSKGSMSLLYLGLHPETKQPLVLKVLSPQFVTHPETVERFLKEAEIIAISNHPNIVKLYGQGEWEGGLYIAMEFIRGISLSQFIFQHSLSLKRSLDIVLQVAFALCHLHTHGIIHRDIKPENVLIAEDGEVKVIDFGIAALHSEAEPPSAAIKTFMGTPNYMSPEQKENPLKATFSSDIYSLGVIAYELVLGKLSYGLINLTLLPKGLRKLVGKALALSQQERYQDIVDFITDVSQYMKSSDIEKDRPGSDQLKEVLETLQTASQKLLPETLPHWEQLEIGLSKFKGPMQLGLYYDFFKFADNTFGILIAEPMNPGLEAGVYMAVFRGMVRTLIHEKSPTFHHPLQPSAFMATLNEMLAADGMKQRFGLSFIYLHPLQDQLSFISCNLGSLIHVPAGSKKPHELISENPPLGADSRSTFSETTDNWKNGDTLILHSLDIQSSQGSGPKNELANLLVEAISENAYLSPQRQSEAVLKKLTTSPHFSLQDYPKALICIQRIS